MSTHLCLSHPRRAPRFLAGFCSTHLVRLLKSVTQGLENASQLVLILAGAWFLVRWKDSLVDRVVLRLKNNE